MVLDGGGDGNYGKIGKEKGGNCILDGLKGINNALGYKLY